MVGFGGAWQEFADSATCCGERFTGSTDNAPAARWETEASAAEWKTASFVLRDAQNQAGLKPVRCQSRRSFVNRHMVRRCLFGVGGKGASGCATRSEYEMIYFQMDERHCRPPARVVAMRDRYLIKRRRIQMGNGMFARRESSHTTPNNTDRGGRPAGAIHTFRGENRTGNAIVGIQSNPL